MGILISDYIERELFTGNKVFRQRKNTGSGVTVIRNRAAAATDAALIYIENTNVGDDQPAVRIRQNGTGDIIELLDGATSVVRVLDGGQLSIQRTAALIGAANIPLRIGGNVVGTLTALHIQNESGGNDGMAITFGDSSGSADFVGAQIVVMRRGAGARHDLQFWTRDINSIVAERLRIYEDGQLRSWQQPNGQALGIQSLTELTAIDAAAFTDTTIQIPANALVVGVSVLVTTVIPTAATFDVGVAAAATRYATAVSTAATTAYPGTDDGVRPYAAATAIRLTPNLVPAANTGRVRVTIHYFDITPPSS